MCFTGAAPISLETLQYFGALYIPIMELYGMSECTGPQTVSSPGVRVCM
jgi:long-subunit acyl-CoA synthetase (AMP-forming)